MSVSIGSQLKAQGNSLSEITERMEWNTSFGEMETEKQLQLLYGTNTTELKEKRLQNLVYKTLDYGGYVCFEFVKWGIEIGYNDAETINGNQTVQFIKNVIYIWVGVTLFPLLIPILALIYLTYTGIRKLFKKITNSGGQNGKD